MTRKILFVMCIFCCPRAYAQDSFIKGGVNLNSEYVRQPLGQVIFPSFEINFEKTIGKKFSSGLGYSYGVRKYSYSFSSPFSFPFPLFSDVINFTHYDHTIIPEIRYYLKSPKEGVFFQLGIPITYSFNTRSDDIEGPSGSSISLGLMAGVGYKYALSPKVGFEINFNINPTIGTSNSISSYGKSGFRLFYNLGK